MRGKMLFVSIALLVMLFFVETASAQVNVATLKQLQAALAGNDEEIIVTKTIVIDGRRGKDSQTRFKCAHTAHQFGDI